MKRIVLAVACVLAVAGCEKDEDAGGADEQAEAKAGSDDAGAEATAPDDEADEAAGARPVDEVDPKGSPPAPTEVKQTRGDCSTEYAPRPKRDPNPMCKVEGGTFQMGNDEGEYEGPMHPVTLSDYDIDQFEVTVAQVVHYLNAFGSNTACNGEGEPCFGVLPDEQFANIEKVDGEFRPVEGAERHPVKFSSRAGARHYCQWVGKQLATEAQWEYAARHDPDTGQNLTYPWGDEFEPERANCAENACKDGFKGFSPVGTFDGDNGLGDGASPWGVRDMFGNQAEWVTDCFRDSYDWCASGCRDPVATGQKDCTGIVRGGSIHTSENELMLTIRGRMGGPVAPSTLPGTFRCVGQKGGSATSESP